MPLIRKPPDPLAAAASPPDQRWEAARAAQPLGDVPTLARALAGESDRRVREALFTGLARIGTPESAGAAAAFLRSDDASLRSGALDALRAMPDAAKCQLAGLLADPDADVRVLGCDLARDVAGVEGAHGLLALLEREPLANVCAAAVESLAEIGDATALDTLRRCAARFSRDPFLTFAIRTTIDRLAAEAKDRND
jgi:HEAT repeat protein